MPAEREAARFLQALYGFVAPDAAAAASPVVTQSGLVTILFTDMEGSTALTQRLGDAKAQDILREHNTVIRDALKAHGGSEIKHTGDGIMASFGSASRALNCAVAIQQAFTPPDPSLSVRAETPYPVRVRIGLNAGEPVADARDLPPVLRSRGRIGSGVVASRRIERSTEAPHSYLVLRTSNRTNAGRCSSGQEDGRQG